MWLAGGPRSRPCYRRGGCVAMAKYMDVHSGFTGRTADQPREAHQRDLELEAAEAGHPGDDTCEVSVEVD